MRLASIWRHPVKAVGREGLETVALTAGRCLPDDRRWAVTHEDTREADEFYKKITEVREALRGSEMAGPPTGIDDR